jgi:hypothetical protein
MTADFMVDVLFVLLIMKNYESIGLLGCRKEGRVVWILVLLLDLFNLWIFNLSSCVVEL